MVRKLILRKNPVLLKEVVLYLASKWVILVEKGFFCSKFREKGCFLNLGMSMVYTLVGNGEPGPEVANMTTYSEVNKEKFIIIKNFNF